MVRPPKGSSVQVERDEYLQRVGLRIKHARSDAKLTQKELGLMIGAPQSWIYLAEDGQQNLQLSSLRRIAEALGVGVRDLLPEGPESGPEFDALQETNEAFQKLIGQLTEATGIAHRLHALSDRRKSPAPTPTALKPKKEES